MAFDFEDLSYPPDGGRWKLIILGIIVPGIVAWFGHHAWTLQQAWWPGRGGGVIVRGESAQAMAVVYMSVAALVHFRWFWGLLQARWTFQVGTTVSLLSFLGAMIWALCAT